MHYLFTISKGAWSACYEPPIRPFPYPLFLVWRRRALAEYLVIHRPVHFTAVRRANHVVHHDGFPEILVDRLAVLLERREGAISGAQVLVSRLRIAFHQRVPARLRPVPDHLLRWP